jgi:hypothetical protein
MSTSPGRALVARFPFSLTAGTTLRASFARPVTLGGGFGGPGEHEVLIQITRSGTQAINVTDYIDNVSFDVPDAATPLPAAPPLFVTAPAA